MNTVTPVIQAAIDAMSANFISRNMGALDAEQIECFNDPARRGETMGMLQDMRDRCGLPQSIVSRALAALTQRDGPCPAYLAEFPDFGMLDVALPKGFDDHSWHNNTCPNFTDGVLNLWINYKSADMREHPESERFIVDDWTSGGVDGEYLATDSWDEVLYFINAVKGYTHEQRMFIGERIAQIKKEVSDTVGTNFYAEGKILPDTISTFGELHDYCDANELGGLCDDDITDKANALFPERTDPDTISTQAWMEACEVIQCTVNVWLASMPFVPLENDAPIVAEDQAPEAADTLNIIEGVFDGGGIERVDGMTTAMQARQA